LAQSTRPQAFIPHLVGFPGSYCFKKNHWSQITQKSLISLLPTGKERLGPDKFLYFCNSLQFKY